MEKAALSLVAAVVSPVITKLSGVAASYFGSDISRKELRHLQTNIIPKIQTVIQQAEKIDAPTLKPWLMELQAAAYEAEDLLDMYEYNKIKNDVSRLPASLKEVKGRAKRIFGPILPKTQLKKSLEKLMQAAVEADKLIHLLNLVNSTTTKEDIAMRSSPQQRIMVSRLSSPVFRRDQECDALVNILITEPNDSSSISRNVTMHAIHGIGGAGKTTLAQRVYNDERVKDHFGLKIWFHVSCTFDPYRITKEIIEAIEKGSCFPVVDLDVLQNKLKELLKSKRSLLVLDDVWTEDWQLWDLLLIPFYEGMEVGSRILMTARMKETIQNAGVEDENILSLSDLGIEECRSIFKYYAFDDPYKAIEDPELADICEKILWKLKNSPLAARLTGSLLRQNACTAGAWRRILDSDMIGDTLDAILLSFQHLPPHLQRCFALCSLYPKDKEYSNDNINELACLWIAQGYVEATKNESLENKGRQYFDDLLSYSLFQSHPTYKDCYVMHDLVHDVAEMVSKGSCFRVDVDKPVSIPSTVVHISFISGKLDIHMDGILRLTNLRTLVVFSESDFEFSNISKQISKIFEKLTKLRVLQFGRCLVPELNGNVGNLKHLRYLQFRGMKKLPKSFENLRHLQYLDVEDGKIVKVSKGENLGALASHIISKRKEKEKMDDAALELVVAPKLDIEDTTIKKTEDADLELVVAPKSDIEDNTIEKTEDAALRLVVAPKLDIEDSTIEKREDAALKLVVAPKLDIEDSTIEKMEDATLKLAVALVLPLFTKLGNVVASYFGGDISRKELRHLQTNTIPNIIFVIQQADKIDMPTLKPWLMELQAAAYEAEDLLDMYEYKKIKHVVSRLPASLKTLKSRENEMVAPVLLKTELKKSLGKLKQFADDAENLIYHFHLVHSTTTTEEDNTMKRQKQQRTTASGLSSPVFGRHKESSALVNMLISEPHESSRNTTRNVTIHAIHGIGGAGKTTLAQRVYNDERVEDHFNLKIWICVSRTFDTYRITKEIIEAIEKVSCSPFSNLDALQSKLKELLKSKKILLVLDDIWIEDVKLWAQLLVPIYERGEVGSRILMTSRMEIMMRIAGVKDENIIYLNELKIEECRAIFKYYAFDSANEAYLKIDNANKVTEDPEVANISEMILHKVKYSPLAARLTGSLLRQNACTVDAWRRLFINDTLGKTLHVILLSFQHLPPHLQRCFALCSLHPEGQVYNSNSINELVRIWIAQGYVEATENELLEDKGKQYFDDLLSYSLFQTHPAYKGCYVMHDLVHEVAKMVSENYCFRIEGDDPISISATLIHLSISSDKLYMHMYSILKLVNLRTLIIFSSSKVDLRSISIHIVKMFKELTKLRVLQFGLGSMLELDSSVGNLKHLQLLQLRGAKKLPESLGILYHLRYLDIEGNAIKEAPKGLDNLVKLQYLFPDYFCSKIENIGKLVSLHELEVYSADRTKQHGLQQLKNLQQIRGSLKIEGLENIKNKTEAMDAMLKKKRHLDELILEWDNNRYVDVDIDRDEDVLEGLKPHPNLKKLEIYSYRGAKLPSWMIGTVNIQDSLPNMTSLNLFCCPNLIGIPNLSGLLKELIIEECPKLMELFPYPCGLERLHLIRDCPAIEYLLSNVCKDDKRETFRLKHLDISRVSVLDEKTLNGFLMNNRLSSLRYLHLQDLTSITTLHLGPHFKTLEILEVVGLKNLRLVKGMKSLTSLKFITVTGCPKFITTKAAAGGGDIANFKGSLRVDDPLLLLVLFQKHGLNSLRHLQIRWYSQDIALSAEQDGIFLHLTSLEKLAFIRCEELPSLPGTLDKLSSLKSLELRDCFGIESLPNLPSSLESLEIKNCFMLESLPSLPSSLESLSISDCREIESMPNPNSWMEKYKEGGPLHHHISHIPEILFQQS